MTTGQILGIIFVVGFLLIILGIALSPSPGAGMGGGMAIGAWCFVWVWVLIAYAIYSGANQSDKDRVIKNPFSY